jgi:hypothetical protein
LTCCSENATKTFKLGQNNKILHESVVYAEEIIARLELLILREQLAAVEDDLLRIQLGLDSDFEGPFDIDLELEYEDN